MVKLALLRVPGCLLFAALVADSGQAVTLAESRARFDAALEERLAAVSPEAAALFRQANEQRTREDHFGAALTYARVAALVPGFSAATRRQAGEEAALGNRDTALRLYREALATEDLAENHSALAAGLVSGPGAIPAAVLAEAKTHVARALEMDPDDYYAHAAAAQVALRASDPLMAKAAALGLLRIAPEDPTAHYLAALAALLQSDEPGFHRELNTAVQLGFPIVEADRLRNAVVEASRPRLAPWLRATLWALGAWVVAFGALFWIGSTLNRKTLAAIERFGSGDRDALESLDVQGRRLYRSVLGWSSGFFWASIPIVLLLVIGGTGGALLLLYNTGRIPIKLALIILIAGVTTLVAIVRSLAALRPGKDSDPGIALTLSEQPALERALQEEARVVDTRQVDRVFLTPGTDFAVFERGRLKEVLKDRGERCLVLGLGVLEGLDEAAFRAILAHEYGHFTNRDTAAGGRALAVRRTLHALIVRLATSGVATWYNPAWHFARLFEKAFLGISQGASRLQEVLADRCAVLAHGAVAFERGLRGVIERSVRFDAWSDAALNRVIEEKQPLPNLYALEQRTAVPENLDERVIEELEREPSPYDSLPSPQQRFRWARQWDDSGRDGGDAAARPAWGLFENRAALEHLLTAHVRKALLANNGVALAAE